MWTSPRHYVDLAETLRQSAISTHAAISLFESSKARSAALGGPKDFSHSSDGAGAAGDSMFPKSGKPAWPAFSNRSRYVFAVATAPLAPANSAESSRCISRTYREKCPPS